MRVLALSIKMPKYLYTPFPRPKKSKSNIIKIYALGLLISLFIIIFNPFDIYNNTSSYYALLIFLLGALFSSAIVVIEFAIPNWLPKIFHKWNLGKAILWYTFLVLYVIAVMFLAKSFLAGFSDFTLMEYINVLGRIFAISLIVSFFGLGIINYLNKEKIASITSKESYKITSLNASAIQLNLNEVLYITSDDNYVDIHLLSNSNRKKKCFVQV